jgi:hypothetical protein
MSLVCGLTAQRIQSAVSGIDIRHLLNKAVKPQLAIDWQSQGHPLFGHCVRRKHAIANESNANRESQIGQAMRCAPVCQTKSGRSCTKYSFMSDPAVWDQSLRAAHGK